MRGQGLTVDSSIPIRKKEVYIKSQNYQQNMELGFLENGETQNPQMRGNNSWTGLKRVSKNGRS